MDLEGEDWAFVGYPEGNRMPGNGNQVSQLATRYQNLYTAFDGMADDLQNLQTNAGMSGDWVSKFTEKIGNMPKDFRGFANGFKDVHSALNTWSTEIDSLQGKAFRAFIDVANAKKAQAAAQQKVQDGQRDLTDAKNAYDDLDSNASSDDIDKARSRRNSAQSMLDQYKKNCQSADGALESAKKEVRRLVDSYDNTSQGHADEIAKATKESPSLNGFAEYLQYSDAWQVFVKVLEVASMILGVIGLFFGGWIAVIAAAVAVLLLIDKVLAEINGDASWWDVIVASLWTLLDVVPAAKSLRGADSLFHAGKAAKDLMKVARSRGLTEETVSAIGKSALRSKLLGPTKWGDKLLEAGDKLLKSKKDAGGWLKLLRGSLKDGIVGSKQLVKSGKDLLHTLHQDGIRNITANLARQGWKTLKTNLGDAGKAVHQSWKNGVKTVHDFASDWSSARKLAADTAQNYPHNTVMRDFWDGQFKKLDAWNKGSNWTISNTVMDVCNAYTDFRNIHDMKNTVQLGKHMEQWEHMTQWDHLGLWQRTGKYMNAGYDTLKVSKIVKPFVQPTQDDGLTWKNDAKSYVKTLVPDPMKLWNYDTLVNAPGKLVKAVSD